MANATIEKEAEAPSGETGFDNERTPEQLLDLACQTLRAGLTTELVEALRSSSPQLFEQLAVSMSNLQRNRPPGYSTPDAELLEFFATVVAVSREKSLEHYHRERERMELQLRMAREVQQALLPAAPPSMPGYDIAAIHLPSLVVSGDYFDYVPLASGRVGLVIADVAGNGIPAALLMASFRAALRTVLHRECEIADVAAEVNRVFLESTRDSRFVTAFYGAFDLQTGRLTYVNCGHNYPLVLRPGGERMVLESGGIPLGVMEDACFQSASVTIGAGDVLALYTDGVVELTDADGLQFGADRLETELRACEELSAQDMIDSVVRATHDFRGQEGYDDDFTLVVLKRL